MMFKYFLLLPLLWMVHTSNAQHAVPLSKIRIEIASDSILFLENGMPLSHSVNLRASASPTLIYLAKQKGYVNEGFTFKELASKGAATYTLSLKKIKPLPAGYESKMLEVYKVVDKTGRLIKLEASDPFLITALSDKLIAYGFKNIANTDLFDVKQKSTQLKIVGEITEFCQNKMGPGFQISLIANWSVYDVTQEKVVFEFKSAGYSDTGAEFKKELSLALKNAMTGLLSNEGFQQLAQKLNEEK